MAAHGRAGPSQASLGKASQGYLKHTGVRLGVASLRGAPHGRSRFMNQRSAVGTSNQTVVLASAAPSSTSKLGDTWRCWFRHGPSRLSEARF
jgi:hypothetical protein